MQSATKAGSEDSFDSSVQLNSLAATQSTASIPQVQVAREAQHNCQQSDPFFNIPNTPSKFSSFDQTNCMFMGFKKGWGGKEVVINESKLKKAKMFFDYSQEKQFFSMPWKKSEPKAPTYFQDQIFEMDTSMPCFKSVGTGLQVKVSSELQSKARKLLNQGSSYKKSTKLKKGSNLLSQNYIKTVNDNRCKEGQLEGQLKVKKKTTSTDQLNRKSFNWQQYEKEYREQIERDQRKSKSKSKEKRKTSKKKRKRESSWTICGKELELLKLHSLTIDQQTERRQSRLLATAQADIVNMKWIHALQNCKVFKCVLCSIQYQSASMDMNEIYTVMVDRFCKKWIKLQQFQPIYQQVCFKLLKYQYYWPEIANKRCQPSNIIVEISKKIIALASDSFCSYLKKCLVKEEIGRKITLVVVEKYVNHKMSIVFLKLSDGWTTVWSAIQSHNILHSYLLDESKVRVGTKICICLWILHPISNILSFCSQSSPTDTCLQLFYNGSIIMQANAKLGCTPESFYRPLNRCRSKGGLIPLVEGFVIRMFTVREKGKKQVQFSSHFAQILTPEGFTIIIKFILGEQNTLVQYFRLYRCYNFFKLKLTDQGILSFGMDSSKFEEIKICKINQKEMVYPQNVLKLFRKRLINVAEDIRVEELYDVICEKGEVQLKNGGRENASIDGESINKNEICLYQQVRLMSKEKDRYVFKKCQYSSQPKRFPPIYHLLYQTV